MDTIIGQTFRAWDGNTYVCDSSDENGLWMTRVDAPEANRADQHSEWRRNVSPRVVGRTYHPVQ